MPYKVASKGDEGLADTRDEWAHAHTLRLNSMACLFQLAVECDRDHEAALRLRRQFEGQTFTLRDATFFRLTIDEVSQDEIGRWWVSVILDSEGRFLQLTDNPALLAEAGEKLYDRLRSARGYRFAIVGFEVLQFNDVDALPELLVRPGITGLVVCEDLFQKLGQPAGFTQFSEGYVWFPSDYKYR